MSYDTAMSSNQQQLQQINLNHLYNIIHLWISVDVLFNLFSDLIRLDPY